MRRGGTQTVWTRLVCCAGVLLAAAPAAAQVERLNVRISWGHEAPRSARYHVEPVPGSQGVEVTGLTPRDFETGEGVTGRAAESTAGAGDIDGLDFVLSFRRDAEQVSQNIHVLWSDLIAAGDADTASRLTRDPGFRRRPQKLTVRMNPEGTSGFSVTVDQLQAERALWIPSLHLYLTAGDAPLLFEDHLRSLEPRKGTRILDRVRNEPEASLDTFMAVWEDLGHPAYTNPQQRGPGHIVGLTWDSAIHKFGIDRAAGVWNDEGNPDRFRFWFSFGDLTQGVTRTWKEQRLTDGLPVMTTAFEDNGVRYEVEQFAYPLHGPPKERRGDIPMVLLQRATLRELQGSARQLTISMTHRRQMPVYTDSTVETDRQGDAVLFRERGRRGVLMAIEGVAELPAWSGTRDYQREQKRIDATVIVDLPARGAHQFVVKLPSPMVPAEHSAVLTAIDFDRARQATLEFWSDYVDRGALFRVPEERINELFRASLWHALRLPRRHGAEGSDIRIDLPYSNFAYSQTGTPWPINQAVYVDYMLYDLRGYPAIAAEELKAQFRNNQEHDGHVSGYANWVVYTPGMLYAVAQNYLLSRDRTTFERLLPESIKAMEWCLGQLRDASERDGPSRGLAVGPLNDGTGEGVWAFNQAYLFAGLDRFGRALQQYGHPRAAEARDAAMMLRDAIARGFGAASMRSPLVQLRDGTWIPYVPAEALTPRRLLDQWYPTDVDTGAVHLLRLQALPPNGLLADSLLHDHEDNLFYKGWGMANEPVYNQQATAYLLRDEPEAAIRAFYSYIASAFSHSVLEPVEHRWSHGQYFGPPSTDGAWFELYRNMLVHERDDETLLLAQATPRAWLQDGKKIELDRVPTYHGPLSLVIESRALVGEIQADVRTPTARRPETLLVRLRHPDRKRIRSVTINGRPWQEFDPAREWVRIPNPTEARYVIVCRY